MGAQVDAAITGSPRGQRAARVRAPAMNTTSPMRASKAAAAASPINSENYGGAHSAKETVEAAGLPVSGGRAGLPKGVDYHCRHRLDEIRPRVE